MADPGVNAMSQLTLFFQRLSGGQKAMLVGVTLFVIAAIAGLVGLVNRPTYATLYSNLAPQDASKIVDKLRERQIPYTLEDAGRSVLVPKQQVYDLRLSLAGEGLPQSSVVGYEIFERTNLGISDFVQKVNYRRAIEGEIARTILQLDEVDGARVHIVVPEKALFKEDEKPATASVVLKLKGSRPLRRDAIQGIAHLVSSSIEGLDPSNVTILDSRGMLLSDAAKPNSLAGLTSSQLEIQQKVESYLAEKARSLLEGVVGRGNALVQVNADLDFRQVERTLEQYDPQSAVVRSEQLGEEKTYGGDSAQPSTRSNTTTNYEVNKSVERIVENVGNVKRLSVAALVNGIPRTVDRGGERVTEISPRPKEEMDQLGDLVRRAIGFNPVRNDEVTVTNLAFDMGTREEGLLFREEPGMDWNDLGGKGLLVAAMLAGVLLIRSLIGRLRVSTGGGGTFGLTDDDHGMGRGRRSSARIPSPEEELSDEAYVKKERRQRIREYVQNKPEDASRLLKVWLAESN